MKKTTFLLAPPVLLLLAACGGGDANSAAPTATLAVSAISSAVPLSYGRLAQLNVVGTKLDQPFTLTAPGCSTLTALAGASATAKSYSCLVNVGTTLDVVASTGSGTLRTAALPVPDPQVTLLTSKGTVVLELNPTKAPVTVKNFLKYTGDGFYANTIFHRVIAGFMSQGGGFTTGLVQKAPTYPAIVLESNVGLPNLRGTLAMARTNVADSATSQFFINAADNTFLNYASAASPGYAVFGKVVSGQAVVDAINAVATGTRSGTTDVPVTDVLVTSAQQTR